ncbi:hypothetical protein [Paenibacillus sp. A3]|uniref:hypothetical protein n=1 Tax=Paenibacillus sp. A3 TaxID=1337054 RepID=UPI00138F1F55|nr:hypothetical protein [Paenibacillus sp. A3]
MTRMAEAAAAYFGSCSGVWTYPSCLEISSAARLTFSPTAERHHEAWRQTRACHRRRGRRSTGGRGSTL